MADVNEDGAMRLPMFPLGSVLLPGMVLPLHVFEDRYRQLVSDVLAADEPIFGVTLIERGSEVGGGDVRARIGCVARVIEAAETPDGRWAIVSVGTERFTVEQWLQDDPYPLAEVALWDDSPVADPELGNRLEVLERSVRRVAALACELGLAGLPDDLEFADDLSLRSHQLAVVAPIGALDRQRLLACAGPDLRTAVLADLLDEQELLIRAQLGAGGDSEGFDW